jgi:hypothetical protein
VAAPDPCRQALEGGGPGPVPTGADCRNFPVMASLDSTPKESLSRATGRDFAEALDEVIRDQEEKSRARRGPGGSSGGRRERSALKAWLTLLAAAAVSLTFWLGSPTWLQPTPLSRATPQAAEAGLRVEVYHQAMRIQAFAQREGRLPGVLTELGPPPPGMGYERLSPREFLLWMEARGIRVDYSSSESLEAFLGDARQTIMGER